MLGIIPIYPENNLPDEFINLKIQDIITLKPYFSEDILTNLDKDSPKGPTLTLLSNCSINFKDETMLFKKYEYNSYSIVTLNSNKEFYSNKKKVNNYVEKKSNILFFNKDKNMILFSGSNEEEKIFKNTFYSNYKVNFTNRNINLNDFISAVNSCGESSDIKKTKFEVSHGDVNAIEIHGNSVDTSSDYMEFLKDDNISKIALKLNDLSFHYYKNKKILFYNRFNDDTELLQSVLKIIYLLNN